MRVIQVVRAICLAMDRIPHDLVALLGRFSVAGVFWLSAQTKVQNFALNIVTGQAKWGWPRLADSAVDLFRDEYRLPLLSPDGAALVAALGEHVFAALLLVGLASRLSALALLGVTAVIQVFVYPDAYATHGVWATVLLYLMMRGPGRLSLDYWIARQWGGVAFPSEDAARR